MSCLVHVCVGHQDHPYCPQTSGSCAQLIQVQQNPVDLIVPPGSSLKVSYSITGHSNPNLYWYQWTPEAGFTLVFTSVGKGIVNPSEKDRFKSSRPDNLQIVLESDGVGERDSAVWYCAASPHSVPEQLLSCTKTTPTSVGALAPTKQL
uniref:Immunoglobulin V-set domain-containing protein n=1 Tax=Astyanax mexicanus TaxID=7994 RepID=A0A3B1JTJ4_ASTMX